MPDLEEFRTSQNDNDILAAYKSFDAMDEGTRRKQIKSIYETIQGSYYEGDENKRVEWRAISEMILQSAGASEELRDVAVHSMGLDEIAEKCARSMGVGRDKLKSALTYENARDVDLCGLQYASQGGEGSRLLAGYVASLSSREKAASIFREIEAQAGPLVSRMANERGVYTYFAAGALPDPVPDITIEIQEAPLSRPPIVVVIGVNEHYFRKLMPLLATEALSFRNLHFHFAFVGTEREARGCWGDFNALCRVIEYISRSEPLTELPSYSVTKPDGLGDPKTLAACIRFFAARAFLERNRCTVYLSDADMVFQDDIRKVCDGAGTPVVGVMNPGVATIVPWRRIMAGSLVVKPTDEGLSFLADVIAYVRSGLSTRPSWYLDQNALLYAFERSSPGVFSKMPARPVQSKDLSRFLLAKQK